MSESTKIDFRHRRIQQVADITDIAAILVPGSRKERYAAACILFELKWAGHIVPNLAYLENRYDISRRVLQRARAKLSRLGMIEQVGMLNSRHAGDVGWRLSGRLAAALQILAAKLGQWKKNNDLAAKGKEELLVALLRT